MREGKEAGSQRRYRVVFATIVIAPQLCRSTASALRRFSSSLARPKLRIAIVYSGTRTSLVTLYYRRIMGGYCQRTVRINQTKSVGVLCLSRPLRRMCRSSCDLRRASCRPSASVSPF
jgi:hypothetical protein